MSTAVATAPQVEVIFQPDEMELKEVDSTWTADRLLSTEAIFFLKDVVKVLGLDPVKVKKKAREQDRNGKSAWDVMGVRKVWSHWVVRMKVFAPFYRQHLIPKIKPINKEWDGNVLLKQKGIYQLTEVCKLIPFSTYQLRYQAKKNPNAEEEYGVWKDPDANIFVVDMERFAPWVLSLWEGKFE